MCKQLKGTYKNKWHTEGKLAPLSWLHDLESQLSFLEVPKALSDGSSFGDVPTLAPRRSGLMPAMATPSLLTRQSTAAPELTSARDFAAVGHSTAMLPTTERGD